MIGFRRAPRIGYMIDIGFCLKEEATVEDTTVAGGSGSLGRCRGDDVLSDVIRESDRHS